MSLADLDPENGIAGGYWDIDNVRLNQYIPSPSMSVDVPNYSFESPETQFVDVNIASWQKSPQPFWYDNSSGYYWEQLTGIFANSQDPNDPTRIDNCDGTQGAWLFALPDVALSQDLEEKFEAGHCYDLGLGVIGGGNNMKSGVAIEIRLYYKDVNDIKIIVDSAKYTYDANDGYVKHLNDFWITLPTVKETDPWVNKNIGIEIISALTLADLDPENGIAGGYWDIDNVRLLTNMLDNTNEIEYLNVVP